MEGNMEYYYKVLNRYYPEKHYFNLLNAGYSYVDAGRIVQSNMDKIWSMVRQKDFNINDIKSSASEQGNAEKVNVWVNADEEYVEPVPLEWM